MRGLDARWLTLLCIAVAAAVSWLALGLRVEDLVPSSGGLQVAQRFFTAALHPALDYQDSDLPAGAAAFLWNGLGAAWRTVVFAAAAVSLSVLAAFPLGYLASDAFHEGGERLRRLRGGLFYLTRGGIALLRSIHELLWAVLFLSAFGLSPLAAVFAIALPYAGTLAKIFAEMIDEAPRDASRALRAVGADRSTAFTFGLLPAALPDMLAYAFYRFECGLRSSAVLGFFGLPTLGLSIRQSFDNLHYREVWTYLYLLFGLIVAIEIWSGSFRRRLAR